MDFLVLAPPVATPAEPPSGAFLLTAGLAARGHEAALLDLSLELFHDVLADPAHARPGLEGALDYLCAATDGYDPMRHRGATGILHKALGGFAARYPGWSLSLMDLGVPDSAHDPVRLAEALARGPSPFTPLYEKVLEPVLARHRPRRVLVSVAYLSQLAPAIDLVRFLAARGLRAVVGGSLPTSLAATGHGLSRLKEVFPEIVLGDGMSIAAAASGERLLDRLRFPALLSDKPYLSARPVVPLALSTGCHWRRCLFCPDRSQPHAPVPEQAIAGFLDTMPSHVAARRPLVHLVDSAVPPALLRRFLPLAAASGVRFYGFARPTADLLEDDLVARAAQSGLSMLQLGVESGSGALLDRFSKGIAPQEAERLLGAAAEAGVRTYLYLLFGLPGETEGDRLATRDLVIRSGAAADFLNVSLFNLPRHCELAERAAGFGIEMGDFPADGAIRLYAPFTCGGGSPRAAARRFLREVFFADPRIHEAKLRTPRWLRAAHLALMRLPGRRPP